MLGSLERGDRVLLIAAAALFAAVTALAALLARPPAEGGEPTASSWSGTPGGALAAFRLFERLADDAERWERSPEELAWRTDDYDDAERVTLVIAQPTSTPTAREIEAVSRFVRAGGRLLLTGDPNGLAPGASVVHAWAPDTLVWTRTDSAGAATRATTVRMQVAARWVGGVATDARPRFARRAVPGVVEYRWGEGTVVWWAGPLPLSNGGLPEGDHLALLLDSVGGLQDRVVLWDEYFHGSRGRVSAYLFDTPLKWALLQLLLAFAVVCATWSRRFVPARVPASESRASRLEFVDALGGLYARAHAAAVAVRVVHDDVRLRLVRRLGLPSTTSDAALAAAAERRLGAGGPAFARLLERTAAAGDEQAGTSVAEALALVQALDRWDRRMTKTSGDSPDEHTRTEGA